MEEKKLYKREEIPTSDRWATEDIFPSDEAWEEEFQRVECMLSEYDTYRGHLGESAGMLYGCLAFDERVSMAFDKLYCYAHLCADVDTTNQHYQEMYQRVYGLYAYAGEASSFMDAEILAIPADTLKAFRESEEADRSFDRSLDLIERKKAHVRSKEVEEILAQAEEMAGSASQIFSMFNNADTRFPDIIGEDGKETALTHSRYGAFLESKDREVRKAAFQALYETYGKHKNTLAATYQANLKQAQFYAKVRNYPSARAMYLADSNVPEAVYDALIDTVHEFLPLMYRYVALRKKALGLSDLHLYDVYTPIVSEYEKKFSYEEAKQLVTDALHPMGEEYLGVLKTGLEGRWIDHRENVGKRSGAYSSGPYGTHPFVLMSYQGTLDHVFTLAHEMGHALHSYYSNENQTCSNANYKIFVAEVASTCNENLLNQHLLAVSEDPKEKAYILNHFLDSVKGTIFRQTMFAEFEKITHEKIGAGEVLTAEALCQIYKDLNQLYFGEEMVIDEEIALEWARIPHFYTPFYVYQYATGFSAAIALSERILKVPGACDQYLEFLKGGCSKDPIDLLKDAGVDMSSPEPVRAAMEAFSEALEELESLM